MFDSSLPYTLISRKYEQDASFHLATNYYKIKPDNGPYIIEAEEYINDTLVLKFYPANLKNNRNKYQLITGSRAMWVVLGTCLKIFETFYRQNLSASFGFIATPSIFDGGVEEKENNQRFRIYKQTMQNYFGGDTFSHFFDCKNSAYLVANRIHNLPGYVQHMQQQFIEMYPAMLDLQFSAL